MDPSLALPAWKDELDAIVGARAHGQSSELLPRLKSLDERHPNVAEINFQVAWTLETLDRAAEALPYYEKAIALGLPANELSGAFLGLGNTLRTLGHAERAAKVFETAKHQFPENREIDVFLAFALHDLDRHAEAMQLICGTLCETADDAGIAAYQRAIRHAAAKL